MSSKKHDILIFGQRVFGEKKPELVIEYCNTQILRYPEEFNKLSPLTEYDLVILDYSPFFMDRGVHSEDQEIFEKQMLEALKIGTHFCFFHYDEEVPRYDEYGKQGEMNDDDVQTLSEAQLGFRWLLHLNIRPLTHDKPLITAHLDRNEFHTYLERWGASKNYFQPYGGWHNIDPIFSLGKKNLLGFSYQFGKGKLLFIPCQRDFSRPNLLKECLETLINNLITYITRSSKEIPSWASNPIFKTEEDIYNKLENLNIEINELEELLEPYQIVKSLGFLSEYEFEDAIPKFFESQLEISTERIEKYNEDFWIIDQEIKRVAIAETKSLVRGFKKSAIYSVHNHREANGLDEDFPALLIVNAHLNAKSWKEKIRSIDPQDYSIAANHDVLIMRVEDLIYFWNSVVEGINDSSALLELIITESGWLEVTLDGEIIKHR